MRRSGLPANARSGAPPLRPLVLAAAAARHRVRGPARSRCGASRCVHIRFPPLAVQNSYGQAFDRGASRPRRLLAAWGQAPWPFVLISGLLGGVAWGINARLWMRFISTTPEFSWSGTLFIVLGFGIAGLAQSGAYLGRRANLTRPVMTGVRVVTFIGLLPLAGAAGASMFPTIVLGALALTHESWPRWLRAGLGAFALLLTFVTARSFFNDLPAERGIVAVIWFLAVYSGIVWAARFSLGPQLDGWRASIPLRVLGALALAPLILLGAQIAIDLWDE